MSGSRLPNGLPMSFGNDSPFPPMASPRMAPGSFPSSPGHARPNVPPPLPPSRAEALLREQQLRQQQRQQQYVNVHPPPPPMSPRPGHHVAYNTAPGVGHAPSLMPSPSISRVMSPRPDVQPAYASAPYAVQRPMPMPTPPPPSIPAQHHPYRPSAPPSLPSQQSLSSSFGSMKVQSHPQQSQQDVRQSTNNAPRKSFSSHHRDSTSSSLSSSGEPSALSIVLPDLDDLCRRRDQELNGTDDRHKVRWCKDVLKYVERKLDGNRITEPALIQLVDQAITLISRLASAKVPLAEALYLRGDLLASGSFPSYHPKDLRSAFNDFELSARMGYAPSWFRIGRDYEVLGDMARARDAYERGCSVQDVGCIYRMGMANLLGQLELGIDHTRAIPLLKEAADLSDVDTPQPGYVYGMLLSGEFDHVQVAKELLVPDVDRQRPHQPNSREIEAKKRIKRAAYFNFAPAQYRMGWLHEYAQLECPFDPLLSVQYYSLASQGGEVEADLALSKWFLCGADGCFEKNESLAFTFADKAAAKGLASAEFAMGYFFEVGVGCEKDLEVAKKWYRKAESHGNDDAKERIEALAGPEPNALSRKQHEVHVDTQLQRKRTEAKMLSDRRARRGSNVTTDAAKAHPTKQVGQAAAASTSKASSSSQVPVASMPVPQPVTAPSELNRRMTMRMVEEVAQQPAYMPTAPPSFPKPSRTPPPAAAHTGYAANQLSVSPGHFSGYHQGAPSTPSGRPPARVPSPGLPPSHATGAPRRGSDTPAKRTQGVSQASAKPSNNSNSSIPVLSAPSMGPDKKVYETFGEMGFSSNSTRDDKDCVIC